MLRKIREKWNDLRLSGKMLLVYLLLLGAMCCVTVVTMQVNLSVYGEKLYEKSVQELDFFVGQVNDSLADVESFSYNLAMSVEMQQRLSDMQELNHLEAQYSYERYQLQSRLTTEAYTNPIVKSITYTDLYKNEVIAGEYSGLVDPDDYAGLLEAMHQAHGGYVTLAPSDSYPYLLSGRDILKHIDHSMDYLGTYIIACDVAGVIEAKMGSLSAAHSALFVYGPRGMVFRGGENTPERPASEQGYETTRLDGQLHFICWLTDRETGWTYLNSFPYSEIYGQITQLRYTVFGIFAAMFALSVLIMRRLARVVTQPLQTLTRSMQVVETGDFKAAQAVLPAQTSGDETGQLTEEFRVMLEKIDLLIYENYEKQLLLQEMRYQMLQAQINPHFLNNTLNTVAWMVKAGKNDDANKVIMELGGLLRAALSREAYTTVAQDIRHAQAYITIQQFRYGSRASFQVECSGEQERWRMPKMVLQPLVENAILHGVEDSLEHCTVTVSAAEREHSIYLEVRDTGPGMTGERLEAVRNFTAKPKGHGIGLKNIKERLEMAFGEKCRFHIGSEPGKGVTVSIEIPKCEEGELHG